MYKVEVLGIIVTIATTTNFSGEESSESFVIEGIPASMSLNPTLTPASSTILYTTLLYMNANSKADFIKILSQQKLSYYVEAFKGTYRYSSSGSLVALSVQNPSFLYNFSYQQILEWTTLPNNMSTVDQTITIANFSDSSGAQVMRLEIQIPMASVPYAQLILRLGENSATVVGSDFILKNINGKRVANVQIIGYNNQISCSVLESTTGSTNPVILTGNLNKSIASVTFVGTSNNAFDLATTGAIFYNAALSVGNLAANTINLQNGTALQKIVAPF